MDPQDPTPRSSRARLAAVLGTAVLAIPGGLLVSNAFAADTAGESGSTTAPVQQSENTQDERPDGRDCPKEDGNGSGESAAPSTSDGSQETAL